MTGDKLKVLSQKDLLNELYPSDGLNEEKVAELVGASYREVVSWRRAGLLAPEEKHNGAFNYSVEQFIRVNLIQTLKSSKGLELWEIKQGLRDPKIPPDVLMSSIELLGC